MSFRHFSSTNLWFICVFDSERLGGMNEDCRILLTAHYLFSLYGIKESNTQGVCDSSRRAHQKQRSISHRSVSFWLSFAKLSAFNSFQLRAGKSGSFVNCLPFTNHFIVRIY